MEGVDSIQPGQSGGIQSSGRETPINVEQKANILPTFKETTEDLLKLCQENPRASDLIRQLERKMTDWDESKEVSEGYRSKPFDQRQVAQVASWITHSSDFQDLNEVGDFIERYLHNEIDSKNQRFSSHTYKGKIYGNNSIAYREARDSLMAILEPFIRVHKKEALTGELDYWSGSKLASGGSILQNREELERKYSFQRIEMGSLVIYTAEVNEQILVGIQKISHDMEQMITGKPLGRGKIHIMLVPESKFNPRGGAASPDGRHLIVDMSHADRWRVMSHEYTHAYLGQIMGVSKSPSATEGAAVFFARQEFPLDPRNDYQNFPFGFTDVVELAKAQESVGISPTQMLEKRGRKGLSEKYEYSYRFGGFLAEYLVTKFGKEKYLEFYKITCRDELYDSTSSKALIKNGMVQPGVHQRDIITQALRSVGMDPVLTEREFDKLIKAKTLGRQL